MVTGQAKKHGAEEYLRETIESNQRIQKAYEELTVFRGYPLATYHNKYSGWYE